MVKSIFRIVAKSLFWIGEKTGLTYNEVNILLYYLFIPLSWTIMFDCWLGLPITTIMLICIWIGIFIANRHTFRIWCDFAFKDSVDFLNWFNRFGSNYVLSSVIICVLIPLLIYVLLILLLV